MVLTRRGRIVRSIALLIAAVALIAGIVTLVQAIPMPHMSEAAYHQAQIDEQAKIAR